MLRVVISLGKVGKIRNLLNSKTYKHIVKPIQKIKQVFGHTLQAFYDSDRNVVFGDAIEFENCKMIDTANAYELNIDDFTIKKMG